jgi:hypothetical protein
LHVISFKCFIPSRNLNEEINKGDVCILVLVFDDFAIREGELIIAEEGVAIFKRNYIFVGFIMVDIIFIVVDDLNLVDAIIVHRARRKIHASDIAFKTGCNIRSIAADERRKR